MTGKKNNQVRLPEIYSLQVLRGVAAVSVALAHVNRITELYMNRNLHFIPAKFFDWGIDLFFVLSGFIIFYVHRKDFGKPDKLKVYSIKRFIRVYPLYWLITLFILAIVFIFKNVGSGYERDWDVIIKSFLLFPQDHSPILFVGWTLVHEIRFYIIFGLLILLKRSWGIIFGGIFILATLFRFIFDPQGNFFITDYLLSPYNIDFLLGVLGAYLLGLKSHKAQKIYLMSLVVFYIIFLKFNLSLPLDQRVIILGVPFAIIINVLGIYELSRSPKLPSLLLFLGAASYSIYLTHYIFISIFVRLVLAGGLSGSVFLPQIMLFVLFLSVIGGCLVYSLVEKPMLNYLKAKVLVKSNNEK